MVKTTSLKLTAKQVREQTIQRIEAQLAARLQTSVQVTSQRGFAQPVRYIVIAGCTKTTGVGFTPEEAEIDFLTKMGLQP